MLPNIDKNEVDEHDFFFSVASLGRLTYFFQKKSPHFFSVGKVSLYQPVEQAVNNQISLS